MDEVHSRIYDAYPGVIAYIQARIIDVRLERIEENPRVSPIINGGDSRLGFSANQTVIHPQS